MVKGLNIEVSKVGLNEILYLRNLFLRENNFQIRYNAVHERNWCDSWLFRINGTQVGYGSVKGKEDLANRDAIFEFFLIPPCRNFSNQAIEELIHSSGVQFIECQTNDPFLTNLILKYGENIRRDAILFEDDGETRLSVTEVVFRAAREDDRMFAHRSEPEGDWVLERNGEIVATGGFLLHYNMPFSDLYMEVKTDCRRMGYGSFLIQELRKQSWIAGRVPAARCNIDNIASKKTLLKGGMREVGFMLTGEIRT